MLPKTKLIDPVSPDADGIATSQTATVATNLTLDGALISGGSFTSSDGLGRQIGITAGGNDSAMTFTINGKDANKQALTEVVTGATAAAQVAESTGYFLTVTSVAASAATASNVTVGTVDEAVTNTIPLNHYNSDPATISLEDFVGVVNVTVQETFTNIQENPTAITYYDVTALSTKTSDTRSDISNHVTGVRGKVNSFTATSAPQLDMVINQNAMR